jgi:hypothetical protein
MLQIRTAFIISGCENQQQIAMLADRLIDLLAVYHVGGRRTSPPTVVVDPHICGVRLIVGIIQIERKSP